MNQQVVLIDSGGYNIGSVMAALARLEIKAELTADHAKIQSASHVILPGVGAAGPAMHKLRQHDLCELIPQLQQPVLGICLGMQLMYDHSEEGNTACLGIFPGTIRQLPSQPGVRTPHMGWNHLQWQRKHPLANVLPEQTWMYFVHSFAAPITEQTLATSQHADQFTAVAAKDNFLVAQFHPERSAKTGLALLNYFLQL